MTGDSLSYFLKHFKEFNSAPCIYCPGNCITECPTFISTRNLLFSPRGYVRFEKVANMCLQCWRCTFNCPIEYPLPILVNTHMEKKKRVFSYEVLEEGEVCLVGESSYKEQIFEFASVLGAGVILTSELNNPLEDYFISLLSSNKNRLLAYSPEAAFFLGIPHYSEVLNNYYRKLNLDINLHIPCLLLPRKDHIINSLYESGINIIDINYKICIKQNPKNILSYYSLCPKIQNYNGQSLDQLLISVLSRNK